jgi:hypothetical protein
MLDSLVLVRNELTHDKLLDKIPKVDAEVIFKHINHHEAIDELKRILMPIMPADFSNILVAGKGVLDMLMGNSLKSPPDIYTYDTDDLTVICLVDAIFSSSKVSYSKSTDKYQEFGYGDSVVRLSMVIYESIDHILTSFPVDSHCIGFEGANIVLTPRCMHSLTYMMNVLDPSKISSNYMEDLAQCMDSGFAIHIPYAKDNLTADRISSVPASLSYIEGKEIDYLISRLKS